MGGTAKTAILTRKTEEKKLSAQTGSMRDDPSSMSYEYYAVL